MFYDRDPEFDQSRVVADYELHEKMTTEKEKNLLFVGLFGMAAAGLIYMRDGIQITEVPPEKKKDAGILGYNKENEMIIARGLVFMIYGVKKWWDYNFVFAYICIEYRE